MKIKSVILETDKGDEVTMDFDEVEDFMKAMRRLKKSCAEPKPESGDAYQLQQLQAELIRLQMEEVRRNQIMQPQQPPSWPGFPNITYGPSSIGTTVIKSDLGSALIGSSAV